MKKYQYRILPGNNSKWPVHESIRGIAQWSGFNSEQEAREDADLIAKMKSYWPNYTVEVYEWEPENNQS